MNPVTYDLRSGAPVEQFFERPVADGDIWNTDCEVMYQLTSMSGVTNVAVRNAIVAPYCSLRSITSSYANYATTAPSNCMVYVEQSTKEI